MTASLQDRTHWLRTPEDVDAFLNDHPEGLIFKASYCHKSDVAWERIRPQLEERQDLHLGKMQVVENRAASNRVEAVTGVRHESPQLLLMRGGQVVFHCDNWSITASALRAALEKELAPSAAL